MAKKYQGMTIDEITTKYYIRYSGEENSTELKRINSKLSRYWQEVSGYYTVAKNNLDDAESELRRIEMQIDYDIEDQKAALLLESRDLPKQQRWSDKARETLAHSRVMTREVKTMLTDAKDNVMACKEEVAIWHEIRNNLRYISKRIDNSTINMGIEAKITKNNTIDPYVPDYSPSSGDRDPTPPAQDDEEVPF